MKAYVLVQAASESRPIAPDLREVTGVVLAEELRGRYDAIVLASSESHPLEKILSKIRDLPGVSRAIAAPLVGSWLQGRDGEAA